MTEKPLKPEWLSEKDKWSSSTHHSRGRGRHATQRKRERDFPPKKNGFSMAAILIADGTVIGAIIGVIMNSLKSLGRGLGNGLKEIGKKAASLLLGLVGSIDLFSKLPNRQTCICASCKYVSNAKFA